MFRSGKNSARTRRRVNGVGFVAACMAACLAAGMGLAVGLERTMTPPSLSDSSDAGNLALGSEEFDDVRSLNVDVTASPAGGVAFPVSGRVTFASCPADGVVRSGSREYGVDGTPLVSLHTDTPLYRDLAYGDKGDDVTALQNELAALGYGGSRSGVFDWATWDAWRRLYAANAGTATAAARVQQGAFSRALAVWLPAQTMSVSCAASLGSTVTGDSTDSLAFRSLAGVASVKAASLPDGRIQGDRVVEINGRDYPIGDDGIVSDTAALQAMAGWSTYTGAHKDGEDVTSVTVTYKLKKPIGVYSVPASALTGLKGSDGCVVATDGTSVKAHVAGSSLGRTLVTIDGKAPRASRPIRDRRCAMRVDLDHVGHRYADGPLLFHDLTASLMPGHVYALTGPSGAGKSTLLGIIAGWTTPAEGQVTRQGIDSMRWIFQNPHGVAQRTAIDHVSLPLLAKGLPRREAEEQARTLMDRFNLTRVTDRRFAELSGGEAQRLMLARAFAAQPSLMLVDEPTAQLDMHTAATVSESLSRIARNDTIVVVSTHDPNTRDACTDIIDLKNYQ